MTDLNQMLLILFIVLFIIALIVAIRFFILHQQEKKKFNSLLGEKPLLEHKLEQKDQQLLELSRQSEKQQQDLVQTKDIVSDQKAQLSGLRSERDLLKQQLQQLAEKHVALEAHNDRLERQTSVQQTNIRHLEERLQAQKTELQEMGQHLKKEFRLLADEIVRKNAKDFNEQSGQRLNDLLNPFKENLEGLKKKVEETHTIDKAERLNLKSEIERLSKMNEKLSTEADELVKALKGSSKKQGNWGEMILETILEHSGLEEGVHFFREETLRDHAGQVLRNQSGQKMRPDVLIKYPDGRTIILDSKVSLNAYVRFSETADVEEQQKHLKLHVESIKNHIKELSGKDYDTYGAAPDFVMMFIPIEPAFHFALQYERDLWSFAWEKQIILMSPTNLIAALRLVSEIWKRDKQNKHAIDIADRAGALYDKFVGVYESFDQIGKYIDQAKGAHEQAQNRMKDGRGSVLRQVELLKELGAKAKKSLPEPNDD